MSNLKKQIPVSILTICYNESKAIRKTIESVLMQTNSDYEYIIKDGESDDDTNNIIEEYRHEFERKGIRFVHEISRDKGTYDAMNIGSQLCYGKYICFLNAGDSFVDNSVINDVIHLSYNGADVIYGDALMVDGNSRSKFVANMQLIKSRMPFSHQACFIKSDVFNRFTYNPKYRICADYDLVLNIYEQNGVFENINRVVCNYDMSGVSSTNFVSKRKEHEQILWEHRLNTWNRYVFHMAEAYAKSIMVKILPQKIMNELKLFYKKYVKHYKNEV